MSGSDILARDKFCFDASAKTITFKFSDAKVAKIRYIINLTRDIIIYSPGTEENKGYTSYDEVNCILTLAYDTTSMSDTDILAIQYDYEANYSRIVDNSFGMNVVDSIDLTSLDLICQGAGQTINQLNGALLVTMGTTTNSETIIRSKKSFSRVVLANMLFKRSQAIVNNKIVLQLVDVIGDNLSIIVNSTTSATVSIPNTNKYYKKFSDALAITNTALNGQKMTLGALSNVVGAIPERFVIASATYDNDYVYLNFTVSSWTSGSLGTCSVYGWNFIELYMNGSSTYSVYIDCARNGVNSSLGYVASGSSTYVNTSNIMYTFSKRDLYLDFLTNLLTSAAAKSKLGSREECIPDEEVELYLQFVTRNGTTAPASNTTVSFLGYRIRESNPLSISIDDITIPYGATSGYILPCYVTGSVTSTVSYMTMSATSGGVSTRHPKISTASTNATSVKTSGGCINGGSVKNIGTNTIYFKMYNKASAPTVGTDVPVYTIPCMGGDGIDLNSLTGAVGDRFTTGIAYAITANSDVTDTTAINANEVFINMNYV